MKYKHIPLTEDLYKRLEAEKTAAGINANAIIIIALTEYLEKKERGGSKK